MNELKSKCCGADVTEWERRDAAGETLESEFNCKKCHKPCEAAPVDSHKREKIMLEIVNGAPRGSSIYVDEDFNYEYIPSENSAGEEVKKIFKEVSKKLTGKDFEVAYKEAQKEIIRYANLIERIRNRVVSRMHTDDGGYDSTAEDIRKMLVGFDRGD